ncbi:MAG TPA: AP2/ERF family transcription factor [Burkholderiaceae bacterium]
MKTRKGIIRIDNPKSRIKAWSVQINRQSGKANRVFSDGAHGGYHKAYRAASAWLDSIEAQYPTLDRLVKMQTLWKNNRSGITGVYRWPSDGSERPGAYWAAQWIERPHDRPKRRKFSVAHYGERQAKRLAIATRKDALEAMKAAADA